MNPSSYANFSFRVAQEALRIQRKLFPRILHSVQITRLNKFYKMRDQLKKGVGMERESM